MQREWLAVLIGVAAVALIALLASRTVRRVLATAWVGVKALGAAVVVRVRAATGARVRSWSAAPSRSSGRRTSSWGSSWRRARGSSPSAYCLEFRKCLDRVRSFPFDDVERRSCGPSSGATPAEVFASIDPEPLASASIAQVHAAQLLDGQDVVIKVQRPKHRRRRRGRPARPAR